MLQPRTQPHKKVFIESKNYLVHTPHYLSRDFDTEGPPAVVRSPEYIKGNQIPLELSRVENVLRKKTSRKLSRAEIVLRQKTSHKLSRAKNILRQRCHSRYPMTRMS